MPNLPRKFHTTGGHTQFGFTLIEVMVGVTIFAILAAMIVASVQSNGDRNAKLEAQRFVAVMNEVRDEAVITGKIFTMEMNQKKKLYSFSVFGGDQYSETDADALLKSRKLHDSVSLKWEVFEDFQSDEEDADDEAQEVKPRVYITPLGELTAFAARFKGDDKVFVVELNDEGNLDVNLNRSNFF